MKYLTLLLTIACFFSCSPDNSELQILREENAILKEKLAAFQLETKRFQASAFLSPKTNKLKLGEEYEAVIVLNLIDKKNPVTISLFDSLANDTLIFKNDEYITQIKFTPKDTGHYELNGNLNQTLLGETYDIPLLAEFDVKE